MNESPLQGLEMEGSMIPNVISVGKGMTLWQCQTEKFKGETLSLSFVLPIDRESAYLTSLLFSVLLRGTKSYPTVSALNKRLDYLFGTELSVRNFYRGDCRILGLSANMLGGRYLFDGESEGLLQDVLVIMREIFFCPALDENGLLNAHYVESEKELQCDTIRAQKNNPHAYAADRCRALMYESEPSGTPIYGSEAQVRAVTPEMLTAHWKALCALLRPCFFYVGSQGEQTVADAIERVFGDLSFEGEESRERFFVRKPPKRQLRRFEESLPVSQGHLVIGLRTGARVTDGADFYAMTLCNEILGASPVSKLFVNVREKRSLCYSCSSVYNIYKGALLISCGLENDRKDEAEAEILRQIEAMRQGEISDGEWLAAKKSLENAYRQLEDSPAAIESYYFGRSLAGVSDTLEECRRRFAAVTKEEVVRAAKRICADTVFFLRQTGSGEVDCDDEE